MKLLIVEPKRSYQLILEDSLGRSGMHPRFVPDTASALAVIDEGVHFDFICITLVLPDGDGLSLCRKLRTIPAIHDTPLILFTSENTAELRRRALPAGATEVFEKQDVEQLINFLIRSGRQFQPVYGRVLYVEDSLSQARLLSGMLKGIGLEVDSFSRAEEAIMAYRSNQYDLVITDFILEGEWSGLTLISHIRRISGHAGDVPILAITAFDDFSRRVAILQYGADDYVVKPIVGRELMARVRGLIERRRASDSLRQQRHHQFDRAIKQLQGGTDAANGRIERAIHELLDETRQVIPADHASYWRRIGESSHFECVDCCCQYPNHTGCRKGHRITLPSGYLTHLERSGYSACHHGAELPGVELLSSAGLLSMVDTLTREDGRTNGLLRFGQQASPYRWAAEEGHFVQELGTLIQVYLAAYRKWLAEREAHLANAVLESDRNAVMICDRNGLIVNINHATEEMTGYSREELIGQNPRILKSGRHNKEFYESLWQSLSSKGEWSGEIWDRHKSGRQYAKQMQIRKIASQNDETLHYISISSSLESAGSEPGSVFAHYDPLTGLPNRSAIDNMLADHTVSYGALLIGIDRHSHLIGALGRDRIDTLIIEMVHRLRLSLPDEGVVGRLDDDRFIMLVRNPLHPDYYDELARTLLDRLREPIKIGDFGLTIKTAIGIAGHTANHSDQDLIDCANAALSAARATGGDCYLFHSPLLGRDVRDRLEREDRLRKAIDGGQLVLHYQPKFSCLNGQLTGCEALVRCRGEDGSIIPPGAFIALAEESGLIYRITDWVVNEAARQAMEWQGLGLPHCRVAVNLSPVLFERRDGEKVITELFQATGVPPGTLEVEITEGVITQDETRATQLLNELRKLGVLVAMDDFGTGYSSLSLLKRLPIDYLKIDRCFVTDLENDPNDRAIVDTIIRLAHSLQMKVIAEGVEEPSQVKLLCQAGCDYLQGYHLSYPVEAEVMERLLESRQCYPIGQKRPNT